MSDCTAFDSSAGYCYVFVDARLSASPVANWTAASTFCRQSGGSLVSVYDSTVETAVEGLLRSRGQVNPVWTAAIQEDASDLIGNPESLWRWVQGMWCDALMIVVTSFIPILQKMSRP